MHADNVVEVCRIILDGVSTEWATQHVWLVPILGFIRPVDWNTGQCTPHMQFLQQPQCSDRATLKHNDDIWPPLHFREYQETPDMFHHGWWFWRCKCRCARWVCVVKVT